uniref:Mitotic-spindle organizing protein 1 n=1 Tax=Megaselia scalaris TaxID=36166 RepID=T1GJI7_MEGSC
MTQGNEKDDAYLRIQQSQVIRTSIQGISQLLNTGLDSYSLELCMKLLEAGIHPQALADVVNEINREIGKNEVINY